MNNSATGLLALPVRLSRPTPGRPNFGRAAAKISGGTKVASRRTDTAGGTETPRSGFLALGRKQLRAPQAKTGTNDDIVPRNTCDGSAIERSRRPASTRGQHRGAGEGLHRQHAERRRKEVVLLGLRAGNGVPTHDMEAFLTDIEGEAATAFRRILDKGKLPTETTPCPDRWSPPRRHE